MPDYNVTGTRKPAISGFLYKGFDGQFRSAFGIVPGEMRKNH